MSQEVNRVLIYLLRRDLRLADNPIFHEISRLNKQSQKPFTHLLPLYVFPAEQVEVSGFLSSDKQQSPYREARGGVSGFWRCGKLRASFLAESVFDLKDDLRNVSSDLVVRVGTIKDVVRSLLEGYRESKDADVHGVWMTREDGWEEKVEEADVKKMLDEEQKEFKLFHDEKYFIDDRDLPFQHPKDLSDVFTSFRKTVEPLRDAPRQELPKPEALPPLPKHVPSQAEPFAVPDTLDGIISALVNPLDKDYNFPNAPHMPSEAKSAHPYRGGSKAGLERVRHLIDSGSMTSYKDTRNGLLGLDFSTKLAAWLSQGAITARQVHWRLVDFEDGKTNIGKSADGYGRGENKGTSAVRFELLWRDYMRLCTKKFGSRLFSLEGYRHDGEAQNQFISSPHTQSTNKKNRKGANDTDTRAAIERFITGRTGTGLIDASQRELFLTGWTSNRARQNVASYLSKHLGIDWRIGAEWYEMCLIDYDVSSNWGNWQYVAGVGNDPRGAARVFNPVKQAVDYDKNGQYVRTWVPELRDVGGAGPASEKNNPENLMGVFQAWRLPEEEKKRLKLEGVEWVEKPLIRIDYSVNRRGGGGGRGRGGRGGRGGGRGNRDRGKQGRTGTMEKAGWQ